MTSFLGFSLPIVLDITDQNVSDHLDYHGTVVAGTMVQWWLVHWYSGTVIPWYSSGWYSGTVVAVVQ